MSERETPTLPTAVLRGLGPCPEHYRTVRKCYPEGIPLTPTAVALLAEIGVDLVWAGETLAGALPALAAAPEWAWFKREIRAALRAYTHATTVAALPLVDWLAAHPEAVAELARRPEGSIAPRLRVQE